MSTTTKNKATKSVRYTDEKKKEIVDFALSYNAANGRGGQSKASEKFGVSQITVASWLKAAGTSAPKAATDAKTATTAVKSAKATNTDAKSKAGTRYTPEQKKQVTDYVASYNAANGRGGQSKAAEKFGVSPLTVMAWLKASPAPAKVNKVATKGAKAAAPSNATKTAKVATSTSSQGFDEKLSSLLAMSREITRAEAALAQLVSKFNSLKASL